MHEMTVANAIIERLREKLADDFMRVFCIHLRIGRLSCINQHALQFAFDSLAAEGVAPRISLSVTWVEPEAQCTKCGHRFRPEDRFFLMCPRCGGLARLLRGDELHLVEADLKDEPGGTGK